MADVGLIQNRQRGRMTGKTWWKMIDAFGNVPITMLEIMFRQVLRPLIKPNQWLFLNAQAEVINDDIYSAELIVCVCFSAPGVSGSDHLAILDLLTLQVKDPHPRGWKKDLICDYSDLKAEVMVQLTQLATQIAKLRDMDDRSPEEQSLYRILGS